jgi:hypothetical protein
LPLDGTLPVPSVGEVVVRSEVVVEGNTISTFASVIGSGLGKDHFDGLRWSEIGRVEPDTDAGRRGDEPFVELLDSPGVVALWK